MVVSPDMGKPGRKWTGPEQWQVGLAALGVLVAIIALLLQLVQ
ncbi:hypothetical protein ACIQ9R_22675 [Streptomyces sp. NPDC094447]